MPDVSGDAALPSKRMRLRYAGRCRICAVELNPGTTAVYERETKTVVCLECTSDPPSARENASPIQSRPVDAPMIAGPESPPASFEIFAGTAGASAKREYERRKGKREEKIRDAHPYLGELMIAMSSDPQSTRAWATGAQGEEVLGQRLDRLTGRGVHVLHDRRVPRTRANIDHIVVCPSGVFVIDAKKYQGRPSLRVEGGLFRPRTEKLMVGSRDCTKLVDGARKQVDLVKSALDEAGLDGIPVRGMLCFVGADWPLIGGAFVTAGVHVLWPRKAIEYSLKPGPMNDQVVQRIHRRLASSFPPA
jgi:Nuclease-related domain